MLLITSSLFYSLGVAFVEAGRRRATRIFCSMAWLLGLAFLILKFGIEWRLDLGKGLFPGNDFVINGPLRDGAQLFFIFYFLSTGIHGRHLIVGLILVGWIVARAPEFSPERYTQVVIVGLYWSFVDIVWIILYPLIYLIGRGA